METLLQSITAKYTKDPHLAAWGGNLPKISPHVLKIRGVQTITLAHPFVEIFLEEQASATIIFFHAEKEQKMQFARFHCGKNSSLNIWNLHFGTGFDLHVNEIIFEEENALVENHTLYFGTEKSVMELFTTHIHRAEGGISRIFSHGILADEAFARYDGLIRILKSASQTDASLNEKTLLLSPHAVIAAVPGLEIGTNDVRATHSAGITRIDEEQLFYAASRGITEKEAVRLLAEGFLKHLLRKIPEKNIRARASKHIHQYLCRL